MRLTGIDQLQPGRFLRRPTAPATCSFRGSAESEGKFYLNENWTVGWDLTLLSDRFYLNDYRLRALDPTQYFFQDVVSQVYLRGQAGRGFFDLSGYSFQPTNAFLDPRQDPIAVPTFDFHRTFALDAEHWGGIGGEATVELNAANVNRRGGAVPGGRRAAASTPRTASIRSAARATTAAELRARQLPAARHRRRL